jgi:hypothetical protein
MTLDTEQTIKVMYIGLSPEHEGIPVNVASRGIPVTSTIHSIDEVMDADAPFDGVHLVVMSYDSPQAEALLGRIAQAGQSPRVFAYGTGAVPEFVPQGNGYQIVDAKPPHLETSATDRLANKVALNVLYAQPKESS